VPGFSLASAWLELVSCSGSWRSFAGITKSFPLAALFLHSLSEQNPNRRGALRFPGLPTITGDGLSPILWAGGAQADAANLAPLILVDRLAFRSS
jgi:hypothetical protein